MTMQNPHHSEVDAVTQELTTPDRRILAKMAAAGLAVAAVAAGATVALAAVEPAAEPSAGHSDVISHPSAEPSETEWPDMPIVDVDAIKEMMGIDDQDEWSCPPCGLG